MFAGAIARVIEHRRRRRGAAERAIVAHVNPTSPGVGLALGQDRHGRVVAVQRSAAKTWASIRLQQRFEHGAAGAHLVGQGRQAERHAFPGIALGLAIERLMLAELLEQDHRQQAGAGPAAGDHMERRRRLADLLAVPARELLADMLDHLPLARDHFQRLGDRLPQLAQPARRRSKGKSVGPGTITRSRGRCSGKGLRAGRLRVNAVTVVVLADRHLGGDLVLGGRTLQLLELQLHLIEKPRRRAPSAAHRAGASASRSAVADERSGPDRRRPWLGPPPVPPRARAPEPLRRRARRAQQ